MSRVYLVRHGQAGTRGSYDSLSEIGRRQSRLLGEYLGRQEVIFSAAYSGMLNRQRQTGEEVLTAYARAGLTFPDIVADPGWNEFDLDHVYRELAPVLCEEDAEFRREFEEMRAQLAANEDHENAEIHRRWMPCDLRIVQAWIKGHARYNGETWPAFHRRIAECRAKLPSHPEDDHNLIVFTSATPIGIWAALSLDVEDHRAMRLAGVLRNASVTELRLRDEQLRLNTFNGVAHLEPDLWTYR